MSDTCFRYDVAPIDRYELTPEGYLRAWATIARTGVQHYTAADGVVANIRELAFQKRSVNESIALLHTTSGSGP